jgi:hypothetical protein
LPPDASHDPETWLQVFAGLGRRSRLLRLRLAGGRLVRSWTGGPGLGPDGPFPVLRRTSEEVLVGLDQGHLSFRASVGIERRPGAGAELMVTTAVMFHTAWGRRYMTVVKPLHRILVRSAMRRAAQLTGTVVSGTVEPVRRLPRPAVTT